MLRSKPTKLGLRPEDLGEYESARQGWEQYRRGAEGGDMSNSNSNSNSNNGNGNDNGGNGMSGGGRAVDERTAAIRSRLGLMQDSP